MKALLYCSFFLLPYFLLAQAEVSRTVEKWPNGNLKTEMYLDKEGLRHGAMTTYYESGKKKTTGNFEHGLPEGPHREWYKSGVKKHEKHYEKGKLQGPVEWWYDTGQVRTSLNYKDDRRMGSFEEILDNGRTIEQGEILGYDTLDIIAADSSISQRAVPQMNRKRYYSNGLEQDILEYDPKTGNSNWESWYKNGKKEARGTYRYDYKIGKWRYWTESGSLDKIEFYDEEGNLLKER